MKRTAAAFVLLAGLTGSGGCLAPMGVTNGKKEAPIEGVPMTTPAQAKAIANAPKTVKTVGDPTIRQANFESNMGYPPEVTGPMQHKLGQWAGHGGILPAPGMGGPPGVVAGVGMGGPSNFAGMYQGQRTSIRFASPAGMKIAFQDPVRGFVDAGREAPVRYNFPQGQIYRVRLAGIQNRPGKSYYPTLELYPTTLKTVTFLSHSTVPVGFTDEDFDQVNAGNLVVKVIYLPDPQFQDLAAAEEIVSTRLEAGVDPIAEANRRGSILAVIRLGNIDLEDPSTPAMDAPPGWGVPSRPLPQPMPQPGTGAPMNMNRLMKAPDSLPPISLPKQ